MVVQQKGRAGQARATQKKLLDRAGCAALGRITQLGGVLMSCRRSKRSTTRRLHTVDDATLTKSFPGDKYIDPGTEIQAARDLAE